MLSHGLSQALKSPNWKPSTMPAYALAYAPWWTCGEARLAPPLLSEANQEPLARLLSRHG